MDIAYKRPGLDIAYDLVAIIDCILQSERELFDHTQQIKLMLNSESIPWKGFECYARGGLLRTFRILTTCARVRKKKACLHFIGHGNRDGIQVGEREFVSWTELSPRFVSLNEAMSGDLIVNMTTCYGLHGIKAVLPETDNDPFFGIIGPISKLGFADAIRINRLLYSDWFAGRDISEIVRRINQNIG